MSAESIQNASVKLSVQQNFPWNVKTWAEFFQIFQQEKIRKDKEGLLLSGKAIQLFQPQYDIWVEKCVQQVEPKNNNKKNKKNK